MAQALIESLPVQAADLTADWFSRVLSRDGVPVVVRNAQVATIGEGVGMMSGLFRVTLDYAEGSGPASVIVKLPTMSEQNLQVAITFDNYRREVEFYRRAAGQTPLRTPAVYCAEAPAPDSFVLVLEDLSAWDQGDQVAGCSLDRAEAVMDALAALHGSFWGRVDDGLMDWMPDSFPSVMSEGLASGTAASWDDFVSLYESCLTAEIIDAKQSYLEGLPRIQAWINDHPRTVIHGDFRMDNLFFRHDDDSLEVACCDFQAPVRGKGVHDVAYFLSGSIDTAMRRQHERDLIARWVDSLAAQGVPGYGADQAFSDYRQAILVLWTYAVVTAAALSSGNQRGAEWVTAMVERSAAAMTDHDCLALL